MKLYKILLIIILLDFFLLGSGQIASLSALTLRQLLLFISIIIFVVDLLLRGKIRINYYIFFYFLLFFIGMIVDQKNESSVFDYIISFSFSTYILYILTLPPLFIKSRFTTKKLERVLYISTLLVSIFLIFLFAIVRFEVASRYEMFLFLKEISSNDFGVRANGGIFYTGLFFVFISNIFLITKAIFRKVNSFEIIVLITSFLALIQSSTRGFIVIMFLVIIFEGWYSFYLTSKKATRVLFFSVIAFLLVVLLLNSDLISEIFLRDGQFLDEGILKRFDSIRYIPDNVFELIFGKGLNYEYNYNGQILLNLEISYFDILARQGLLFLSFWIVLYLTTIFQLISIYNRDSNIFAIQFCITLIAIMVLSFTNPYLNISLGLFLLALSQVFIMRERSG